MRSSVTLTRRRQPAPAPPWPRRHRGGPSIVVLAPACAGRQPTPVVPPPWCVGCHGSGQRLHQSELLDLRLPDQHGLATYDARRFGGALAHHLHRITNLDHAWTTGQDLCLAGLDPDHPATLAADLTGA